MTTPKNSPGQIENYLFFEGRCEEAIEFYRRALGAEVQMMMRFKESPEPPKPGCQAPGSENKIMHATLKIGETTVMLSDGRCQGKPKFEGFALSIATATEAEADVFFNAVGEGGQVIMPLEKTFYSPRFGMVTDKFGLCWMIMARP